MSTIPNSSLSGFLRPGAELAGYRVGHAIGAQHGSGRVYEAIEEATGLRVALKAFSQHAASDPAFRAAFETGIRLRSEVEHPNLVPILDSGEQEGRVYVVMSLAQGPTLRDVVDCSAIDDERALMILGATSSALDAGHAHGLIYRGLKSEAVLGATGRPRDVALGDFGAGRPETSKDLIDSGRFAAEVHYMSPEEVEGEPPSERSNVYSLAALVFEALTGFAPFSIGDDVPRWAVLEGHQHMEPPVLSRVRPDLPRELDEVLRAGLAKQPKLRPATPGELLAEIVRVYPPSAWSTGARPGAWNAMPERFRQPARRGFTFKRNGHRGARVHAHPGTRPPRRPNGHTTHPPRPRPEQDAAREREAEERRLEAERRAAEARAAEEARLEEEREAEEARIAEERRLEEERQAAEARAAEEARLEQQRRAEEARIAEERRLEAERQAAEARAAEQARLEEERRRAERERIERERLEAEERRAAEKQAAAERRAAERQAKEEQEAKHRAEEERRRAEKQAAEERQAAKKREEAEKRAAAERAEAERRRQERERKQREKDERAAEKRARRERKAAEKRAAEERKAAEKRAAEEHKRAQQAAVEQRKRAEQERARAERAAADLRRREAEQRERAERLAAEERRREAEQRKREKEMAERAAAAKRAREEEERKRAERAADQRRKREAALQARAERKAAEERHAAEKRAAAEQKAAQRKAAEDKKRAEKKAAEERKARRRHGKRDEHESKSRPRAPAAKPAKPVRQRGETHEKTPPKQRGRRAGSTVLAAALVLGAVGLGKLAAGGPETVAEAVPAGSATSGPATVSYPGDWRPVATPPKIPGLALDRAAAVAPAGAGRDAVLAVGRLPQFEAAFTRNGALLLPPAFLARLKSEPAADDTVRLGELHAYRYDNLKPRGVSGSLTLYVVPTSSTPVAAACLTRAAAPAGFADSCARAVSTLELDGVEAHAIGPDQQFAGAMRRVIGRLDSARSFRRGRLRDASTRNGQSAAALELHIAYRNAGRSLARVPAPPGAGAVKHGAVAALRQGAAGWLSMRAAARSRDRGGWNYGRTRVRRADGALQLQLRRLGRLGYDPR